MSIRVLMVNKRYPPHIGGIEFHVADLARALVRDEGAEVTVLVVGEDGASDEVIDGVRVVRTPQLFEYASTPVSLSFRRRLRELVAEHDLVHFHTPYPFGEFVSLSLGIDAPVVVTYHADIVRQKRLLALYRPFLERFLDRADLIIASSPNLIEHSPFLAKRAQKCRHVDFGLPLDRFRETPRTVARAEELRRSLGDRPIVLFVGRLVYYKGVEYLIEAAGGMREQAEFVLIGDGPLAAELFEQAVDAGVSDRFHSVAHASSEELAAWYRAADVLALPSIEPSEAFGLVQIEAHASGTPVVSTTLPTGVPYANLHGVTGLTVPPRDASALADALDRIIGDRLLHDRLAAQAESRAFSTFTLERMSASTRAVYDEARRVRASVRGGGSQ